MAIAFAWRAVEGRSCKTSEPHLSLSNYSLRRRLVFSTCLLLLVFLGVMGIGLNNAFKQSVLSNAEDALKNQILLLMANIDVEDGRIVVPPALSEARLSQMDSDLFAEISSPGQGLVWQSDSLLEARLPELSSELGEFNFFEKPVFRKGGPADGSDWAEVPRLYAMSFSAEWEAEDGDLPFTIQIAELTAAYAKRMKRYQRRIATWLSGLGIGLLSLMLLLLSWAMKPLVKVTRQVGQIEQGERKRFDEDYPREVSRLTQNLNQLLNFEEQRIDRQKEVMGNLAHSLKTPLAVMRGLEYSDRNKQEAEHQLGAMQNIIDYQLQSASAVGRRRFASPIDIRKPTDQIVKSLSKLHRATALAVNVDIADDVLFYGDPGDWMELVGNLLDNAFKWAKSAVEMKVSNRKLDSHRLAILIRVSDDGSGIDEQLKSTILQRGVRLDSQTPGHGLGLHIVKGIVEAYGGSLSIEDNQPAGTVFEVRLN